MTCRRIALRSLVVLAICTSVSISFARSQNPTAAAAKPLYDSPRIATVAAQLASADRDAVARFWKELDGKRYGVPERIGTLFREWIGRSTCSVELRPMSLAYATVNFR